MDKRTVRIALVGQPNVGKSMLINSISHSKLYVGNFSGVTVDKSEVLFEYQSYRFQIIDLPGTYALTEYSMEEKVTTHYIGEGEYDLIINVADSTDLQKNLHLTCELMSTNKKILLTLNMIDEAEKEGIVIDTDKLSSLIGIPVVNVSAAQHQGIDLLLEKVIEVYEAPLSEPTITFSAHTEEQIQAIQTFFQKHTPHEPYHNRGFAINLLRSDNSFNEKVKDTTLCSQIEPLLIQCTNKIKNQQKTKDINEAFVQEYDAYARGIVEKVETRRKIAQTIFNTDTMDNILVHALWGLPIFFFLMWVLFQLTFAIGNFFGDYINDLFGILGNWASNHVTDPQLSSLIADGLIGGVGAVLGFTPNIIILFAGIAILETTGYMARVAFLLDGIFHKFGMHGQSFIPLITGFGCSIPAYMSTRILNNQNDRLLTLFTISFMSCGARLPIYLVITGAIFSEDIAADALFIIYMAGAFLGLIMAKVLKMTAFKGLDEPFVMEMPKYRLPSLKLIWLTVYTKTWMFVKKAGTFIAGASILVWFLSTYPHNENATSYWNSKIHTLVSENSTITKKFQEKIAASSGSEKMQLESKFNELQTNMSAEQLRLENKKSEALLGESFLAIIGKTLQPIMTPLGLGWKETVALLAGLAAKEVVVSTLGVLYSMGSIDTDDDNATSSLISKIRSSMTLPEGVSFIVIVMIYLPCLAATSVFYKETGSIKYVVYQIIYTSALAYFFAFVAYRVAKVLVT